MRCKGRYGSSLEKEIIKQILPLRYLNMNTINTKFKHSNDETISEAAQIIKSGGLVAFPTETVYGLGANALSEAALKKIFEAKGRPSDNPLIAHVSDVDMLLDIVEDIPEQAQKLIKKFWPGPLTLIFKKKIIIPGFASGGLDTIGVRMPDNDIALRLIREAGVPIAAPSANTSGKPSPTTARHVIADLDGKIDMVIDGGNTVVGLESTIVDLSGGLPKLLRPGAITLEMLEETVGKITTQTELLKADDAPKAPGMKYKHYAPTARLTVVKCENANCIIEFIKSQIAGSSKKAAVIASGGYLKDYAGFNTYELKARELFSILRKIDEDGIEEAYIHAVDETGIGLAIMNRLKKAAGDNVVELPNTPSITKEADLNA